MHYQAGSYDETIKGYRCVCGGYWNFYPGRDPIHRDLPAPNVQQRTGEETV